MLVVAGLVLLNLGEHGDNTQTQLGKDVRVGAAAPDFSLTDVSEKTVSLSSFRGRDVVLLDFWATWCEPCRMSMPALQKALDRFGKAGFEILSLNQGEGREQAQHFMDDHGYTFHVLLDSGTAVASQYGVDGIPTTVLIDKKGIVRRITVGYSGDGDKLQKAVENLLKEKP